MDSEIKTKLSKLLEQPHILLLGAGASVCAGLPDLKGLGEGVENGLFQQNMVEYLKIKAEVVKSGISNPSVEDIFSHIQLKIGLFNQPRKKNH